MSFFIKKNKDLKLKGKSRKRSKSKFNDEQLSSDDEEANTLVPDDPVSEDDNETVQEKRLRLAKVYLEEIEKEESEKLKEYEEREAEAKGDVISNRLKRDYLKEVGKLRLLVAEEYSGANVDNIRILKCKLHNLAVTCVCLAHKDHFIYSGSKDGSIVKWSLSEQKKISGIPFVRKANNSLHPIVGHSKAIMSITISWDDEFLAVSDEGNHIQIWSPSDLRHLGTLTGHQRTVTGLAFRQKTHTLYSSSKDRSVKVWSLDDMSYIETVYGHQGDVTSIDAFMRECAITSGGGDHTIRLWKFAEDSQLIYNGHSESVDIVRLINEQNFITGGDNGELCVWSIAKKKPLCSVREAHGQDPSNFQPYWITSIAPLPNTNLVATGSYNGCIKFWKLEDNFRKISRIFEVPAVGFVNDMAFTKDGNHIIAAIGTEHRSGRWKVIRAAKNGVMVIPFLRYL